MIILFILLDINLLLIWNCWLQILKDVSEEHAKKTITVDPFPHGNFTAASIHPCKHSAVMKKMISMAAGSATSKELIVDQ